MKAVPWLALALSLAGALVAAGAYSRVRSAVHAPPATASAEIESLRSRIAGLEAELKLARDQWARLEREPKSDSGPAHEHPLSGPGSGDVADLKRRIELLERQVASGRSGPIIPGRTGPADPALVEREKKTLTDSNQSERARATALSRLRMHGAHKADDIVEAALALLGQARETNIRTLVIRNLQGTQNSRVIPTMLGLLKGDPEEDVRDEAARVLGDFVGQPEVKAALQQASTGDVSDKVKRRAQAALNAPPKPN